MKIKPLDNYCFAGFTGFKLNKNKIYNAEKAYNIPNNKEQGFIFVKGLLLNKFEYTIVK